VFLPRSGAKLRKFWHTISRAWFTRRRFGSAWPHNRGRRYALSGQPAGTSSAGSSKLHGRHFSLSGPREDTVVYSNMDFSRLGLSFIAPRRSIPACTTGGPIQLQSATLPGMTSTGRAEDATCCPRTVRRPRIPLDVSQRRFSRRLRAACETIARGSSDHTREPSVPIEPRICGRRGL